MTNASMTPEQRKQRARKAATTNRLRPFVRPGLDVLFIALNPPEQSNANGHYFSGERSAFFKLLAASGLITKSVLRATADEQVFGTTEVNFAGAKFGVVDLVQDVVETNSGNVRVRQEHVKYLIRRIRELNPRFVCVIHSKVRDGLNRHGNLQSPLDYGWCGAALADCKTEFVVNYFPNGNAIADAEKIRIFGLLRDKLLAD